MADANPTRLGQINGTGDALAIFLKVFAGEVLQTFLRQSAFRERHLMRTIASGKSAQFPATGVISAYYHNPGDEILGNRMNVNERVIALENLLIAPAFIPNIDEAMAHFDYRGPISKGIGLALSKQFDGDVARSFMMSARNTTPNVLGVFPNDTLTSTEVNALFATDGPTLFNGIFDAGVTLDQRDIPHDGRSIFVRPLQGALLVKSEKPIDRRFNPNPGASYAGGIGGVGPSMMYIDDMPVVVTNNYVNTDDRTSTLQPAGRQHDFSTSMAIIAHETGAASVSLQDVTMEAQYDMRRQGWLTIGKYLTGHDQLRPEAAFELQSGAPAG